jgi:LmbE family N-acetylglucosaminyl deacetylase
MKKRVAVVSPHLDDAVLSAWLVLTGNRRTRVISCFAGIPQPSVQGSWDRRTGLSSGVAVAERRAEDLSALALAESEAVHLDLLDEQYRGGRDAPRAELARLLREHLVDADEVWLPAGLGGHVDHVAARDAALLATGSMHRVRLYADLPYAGQPAWPVDVTGAPRDLAVHYLLAALGRPARAQTWRSALEAGGVRMDLAQRHIVKLTSFQFKEKVTAVRCYRSQMGALRCGSRHPFRERRLFAHEVYWTIMRDLHACATASMLRRDK